MARCQSRHGRSLRLLMNVHEGKLAAELTSRVNAKDLSPITAAGTAWAVLGLIRAGT